MENVKKTLEQALLDMKEFNSVKDIRNLTESGFSISDGVDCDLIFFLRKIASSNGCTFKIFASQKHMISFYFFDKKEED